MMDVCSSTSLLPGRLLRQLAHVFFLDRCQQSLNVWRYLLLSKLKRLDYALLHAAILKIIALNQFVWLHVAVFFF